MVCQSQRGWKPGFFRTVSPVIPQVNRSTAFWAGRFPKLLNSIENASACLSLTSVDPDAGGGRANRRLMLRAEEMLERLEEIRHGLLMGSIPKSILADLAQMVRSRREAGGHPHLIAILDEIELRAEVELAKLSKFANEPSAERT
ncbi:MAG: hypothetical protein EB075_10170 [Bacteroidetes bacterium]|nr:hypothetical protein [Bacteroidota bacterium]